MAIDALASQPYSTQGGGEAEEGWGLWEGEEERRGGGENRDAHEVTGENVWYGLGV